ncbi:MAG: hypothetical protein ACYTG1_11710 [Planctomycetota bacterium]
MSLASSHSQLKGALTELRIKWDEATRSWDDPVSRKFEEGFLVPLDRAAKPALQAMEQMGELLARARRECE